MSELYISIFYLLAFIFFLSSLVLYFRGFAALKEIENIEARKVERRFILGRLASLLLFILAFLLYFFDLISFNASFLILVIYFAASFLLNGWYRKRLVEMEPPDEIDPPDRQLPSI